MITLLFLPCVDSGCDSVTDAKVDDDRNLHGSCDTTMTWQDGTRLGNLIAVQPDRICCGVQYVCSFPVATRGQNEGKGVCECDAVL